MREVDFGKAPYGELFTIAVALMVGSVTLYLRDSSDPNVNIVMSAMCAVAISLVITGLYVYYSHMQSVRWAIEMTNQHAQELYILRKIPPLAGDWTYEVKDTGVEEQKHLHSGKCIIKKNNYIGPRSFVLHGTRLNTSDKSSTLENELTWDSTWCEFNEDGRLRFDYEIDLDNQTCNGRANLVITENPLTLKGKYSIYLPDGNLKYRGIITFEQS